MKTITRNYIIVCPSCKGLGYIENPLLVCTETTIRCSACKGQKTVMVEETEIESEKE